MKRPNMAPNPPPITPAMTVLPAQLSMLACICSTYVSHDSKKKLRRKGSPYIFHHHSFLLRHASGRVLARQSDGSSSGKRHCVLREMRVRALLLSVEVSYQGLSPRDD